MTPKKIKIGAVIGSSGIGGTEMDMIRNFPRMDRNRFEMVVINFASGQMDLLLREKGIRVLGRPPLPRPPRNLLMQMLVLPVQALQIAAWIGRVLKREQVDIAHFFLPHAYILGMLGSLRHPRARRVMSRKITREYHADEWIAGMLERHVMHRFVDLAVGNCRAILDDLEYEGIPRDKLHLLYNGIETEPFNRKTESRANARRTLGLADPAFVMVAVGNLHVRKGHRELIEACAQARDRFPPDWALLIAGRDEAGNQTRYETLIQERGLAGHVRLLGKVENIRELLFAADLFVHPSHEEGLPNAILEAMAASLPIIGTTIAGIPEELSATPLPANPDYPLQVESGWLLPAKDRDILTQALRQAASDPERLRQIGEQANQRVRDVFSIEKSTESYESLYEKMMTL